MDALILLGSFIALILIGMPVAYALGMSALIGAWWIDIPFQALMIQVAGGVNKFSLMAIPFFVLAGAIMAEGGMSRRLVAFAGVLVGFVRGGLSLVNIVASTFFGAISGSALLALFRHRASLGGIGILALILQDRTGFRAGWTQLAFDAALFAAALTFLPLRSVALSFLGSAVVNLVIAVNHRRDRYIAA